ncbi:MAG: flagellar assembly protein FliW [Candidatus Eisenbacteria bacterium]|nr:flagellar assembly protein FliW [Candidatus Eisenbacteria bacterium]
MRVETTRFGALEAGEEEFLGFPDGLYGFGDVHRYLVVNRRGESPFQWLQSVDRPDLAFVVLDPSLFCPGYRIDLSAEDRQALGWDGRSALDVWVVVGVPDNPEKMTANLKGPIIVNRARRIGRQVILPGDEWSPRHNVIDGIRGERRAVFGG